MNTSLINNLLNKTKWQVIFLASVIFFLYLRTLSFQFIGLDEHSLLQDKQAFNKELSNIPAAFTQHVFQTKNYIGPSKSMQYYRPLLTVSFIIDEQFSRNGFAFFRFSNILIHLAAVIGLLLVLQQMKVPHPLVFLLTLLFAVHPLLTQAIAWIPGRNDSLACAFVLWSFYFLMRSVTEPRNKNIFLHLLFFAAALFTKENAVMFWLLCMYSIFILYKEKLKANQKVLLLFAYILLITCWHLLRHHAVKETAAIVSASQLYDSFLKNIPLLLQYFQKSLLPVNLAVMASIQDTNYSWVIIAVVLFGAAIYFTKKTAWREIIFGLLWFFVFLLPTLLFSYFEGMEHRSYLPMAGLLIAIAHTGPVLNLAQNKKRFLQIFGILIIIFAFITHQRLPTFSNELSYWENAYETSRNSTVVLNYGATLTQMEDYPKAEEVFQEGIKQNPKAPLLLYNLGILYFNTNNYKEAERYLLEGLHNDSTENPLTFHVLGLIYKQTGRMPEAVSMWKKAVAINPGYQPPAEELKNYYLQAGDTLKKK